jgi:GxxExxY protein
MREQFVSGIVVQAAIEVHRTLGGPGLLETTYEEALAFELIARGMVVRRQVPIPLWYKGNKLKSALQLDLLIDDCVIVECKSTRLYNTIFESQALTYLRLSNRRLALVINFGEKLVSKGIHRVVNNFQ